jgi:formamidopyrimidine-DNA glycosylase
MPELPDIAVYLEALERRVLGRTLEGIRLISAFLLRSVDPPIEAAAGRRVVALRRIGKRIVLQLDGELFAVLHLMIAGRLRWVAKGRKPPGRISLAVFEFDSGQLIFTEAGTKRRASLHLVQGEAALRTLDPGGIDVLQASLSEFEQQLRAGGNHTVKRSLTDPHLFSGIGNAYSDEILHRAGLSPFAMTTQLTPEALARLHGAMREVLQEWIARLREQTGEGFPEKVTAFRPEMAVHGRYGQPCPVCGSPVQRIVYAENETNYCARCQTGGRLLADRALSRLLHKSWPKNIDELG